MKKLGFLLFLSGCNLVSYPLMGMNFDSNYVYDQTELIRKHYPDLEKDVIRAQETGILSERLQKFQESSVNMLPWRDAPTAESEFRKRYWKSLVNQLGKGTYQSVLFIGLLGTGAYGIAYITDQTTSEMLINTLKNPFPLMVSLGGLAIGGLSGINNVTTYLMPSEFDRKMGKQEKKYLRFKLFYTKSMQKKIETVLTNARHWQDSIPEQAELISKILALPVLYKPISFDSAHLQKFRSEILDGYLGGNDFCDAIELLCFDRAQNGNRKQLIYFYGPPGTGKTYLAYKIAKFLNVELADVPLANASIESLAGTKGGWRKVATEGRIIEGLCTPEGITKSHQPSTNMILFFDEADKVLNNNDDITSYMLKILDPNKGTFFSPYFASHIDISKLLIILCGNEPIKLAALKNRMKNVKFSGFKPAYRKKAIKEFIFEDLLSHEKLSTQDFYQGYQSEIDDIIEKEEDPGFRNLHRNINDLYNKKILEKYKAEASQTSSNDSGATSSNAIQNGRPISIEQKKTR
jgi:ATPase family associated with various cellular activities (AAA)